MPSHHTLSLSALAIALIAQDLATFSATSEGFSADIPKLDTLKVGIASTTNTVDRKVSAYLLSSTVSASEMAVSRVYIQPTAVVLPAICLTRMGKISITCTQSA